MNPLLISGFGTSINVDSRRLVISNKNEKKYLEFYPHKIDHDSIIVDGHTGYVTFEAMRWILKHNIKLVMLNWNGNLLGTVFPEEPKSGKLRMMQQERCLDHNTRLEIAICIVNKKIDNTLELLKELNKTYNFVNYHDVVKTVSKEKQFLAQHLESKSEKSFKRIMNYEGKIAIKYYDNVKKIFNHIYPEFNFDARKDKARSRNTNASDEINALLNYGYAILESEVRKYINSVGLDPAIGFLHEPTKSKSPLVYDLQELFRWIIDISIIQLLEEKKLKKKDFIITENYNMRLREKTAKLLIEKIKNNFNKKMPYKRNRNHTYQNVLLDNVQILANFISGKSKNLKFEVPMPEPENALQFKVLREKILGMTPKQRKELRINKSTLWYLKKSLESGKKPKIYQKVLEKIELPN